MDEKDDLMSSVKFVQGKKICSFFILGYKNKSLEQILKELPLKILELNGVDSRVRLTERSNELMFFTETPSFGQIMESVEKKKYTIYLAGYDPDAIQDIATTAMFVAGHYAYRPNEINPLGSHMLFIHMEKRVEKSNEAGLGKIGSLFSMFTCTRDSLKTAREVYGDR